MLLTILPRLSIRSCVMSPPSCSHSQNAPIVTTVQSCVAHTGAARTVSIVGSKSRHCRASVSSNSSPFGRTRVRLSDCTSHAAGSHRLPSQCMRISTSCTPPFLSSSRACLLFPPFPSRIHVFEVNMCVCVPDACFALPADTPSLKDLVVMMASKVSSQIQWLLCSNLIPTSFLPGAIRLCSYLL
eukprot:3934390-Rhodomonas_salina.1